MMHIMPLNDLKEHFHSVLCHCNPTVRDGLCIHNALDGRKIFEDALELLKNLN